MAAKSINRAKETAGNRLFVGIGITRNHGSWVMDFVQDSGNVWVLVRFLPGS